jgi:hypothetical protein
MSGARLREPPPEHLFQADKADLQSELESAEHPRRLGLRLEIQACEVLLGQLERVRARQSSMRTQERGMIRPASA